MHVDVFAGEVAGGTLLLTRVISQWLHSVSCNRLFQFQHQLIERLGILGRSGSHRLHLFVIEFLDTILLYYTSFSWISCRETEVLSWHQRGEQRGAIKGKKVISVLGAAKWSRNLKKSLEISSLTRVERQPFIKPPGFESCTLGCFYPQVVFNTYSWPERFPPLIFL